MKPGSKIHIRSLEISMICDFLWLLKHAKTIRKHSKQGTFIDNLFDLETGVKCEISNLTILKDLQPRFCCCMVIFRFHILVPKKKQKSHLLILLAVKNTESYFSFSYCNGPLNQVTPFTM